ncbi:hypothetical protein SteCoe_6962 [Stentor coeruleus]|uniref:Uncharacterized protein n=1 Tax=Stentor coeruleus TaxID=5963 RepID=A0A1R2CNT7_9CILI|nr:hypothetical protein SteCoe_6962 [Stentor coeruleus]
MEPEILGNDNYEQKRKLDELVQKKHELEKRKLLSPGSTSERETYRYEELIRNKNRKTTKGKDLDTAFCVESKHSDDKFLRISREPIVHTEGDWLEQVREKDRKLRREETRIAQERLKIIDKRSRYPDIIRENLSPSTRALLSPEPQYFPRSSSKQELMPIDDRASCQSDKYKQQESGSTQRLKPRSLSRNEKSPPILRLNSNRTPYPRKTVNPNRDYIN